MRAHLAVSTPALARAKSREDAQHHVPQLGLKDVPVRSGGRRQPSATMTGARPSCIASKILKLDKPMPFKHKANFALSMSRTKSRLSALCPSLSPLRRVANVFFTQMSVHDSGLWGGSSAAYAWSFFPSADAFIVTILFASRRVETWTVVTATRQ